MSTPRPQPVGHVFLPADMPTLQRAQIGAYLSGVRLDVSTIKLSGRKTVIPADMHPDMSWDLFAPMPGQVEQALVNAGAVIRQA